MDQSECHLLSLNSFNTLDSYVITTESEYKYFLPLIPQSAEILDSDSPTSMSTSSYLAFTSNIASMSSSKKRRKGKSKDKDKDPFDQQFWIPVNKNE